MWLNSNIPYHWQYEHIFIIACRDLSGKPFTITHYRKKLSIIWCNSNSIKPKQPASKLQPDLVICCLLLLFSVLGMQHKTDKGNKLPSMCAILNGTMKW